ncbi:MAG: glycosyltransferase [Acidobacteriota bacterium]
MRVLLVQRSLLPPGGGNGVAAWIANALAGTVELETLTERRWDPAAVDAFYGTALAKRRLRQRVPRVGLPRALSSWRLDRLRMALLLREARRVERAFDVMVTADNFAAFERPGIQYLHYPAALRPEPEAFAPAVRVYYALCDALSGLSWPRVAANVTLANSTWTADRLRRLGLDPRVVPPPVVDPGPGRVWSDRDATFLAVGRFHGSKRLELVLRVLTRVRARHPAIRLRFVGSPVDAAYTARIRRLAAAHHDWVNIDEDLPRDALHDLMGRSRYGVHAMVDEHFGMAAAEMARGGMIVFCHRSGGLVDVVGHDERLLWDTEDEAVERILGVLASPAADQAALAARLAAHAARFSPERFAADIVDVIHGVTIARNAGSASSS